jgi:hypothetical protein
MFLFFGSKNFVKPDNFKRIEHHDITEILLKVALNPITHPRPTIASIVIVYARRV